MLTYFKTSNGGRYVDQLADGISHETKVEATKPLLDYLSQNGISYTIH